MKLFIESVLDLIDECPGLTLEQDAWLSRRVKELHALRIKPLTFEEQKAIEKANTTEGYYGDYYDVFGVIEDVEIAHGIRNES